ncbi:MAG TPA: hypothetical protein PLN48_00435 [Lachnospiraceae bacterium]|nr:hypothetical protein [Lachnospiraceae bacterium]
MKQNRGRRIFWISGAAALIAAAVIFAAFNIHTADVRSHHLVSNCGEDEYGNYSGGQAGDQTGHEWDLRAWPDKQWTCVLRYPDESIRNKFASLASAAAANDLIGYNQDNRLTFWEHLEASGYDPSKITVPCEADCSAGAAAIVKAVGYLDNIPALQKTDITMSTSSMKESLAGEGFDVLSDSRYLTGPDYLLPGDIVLCEKHHVVINITEGSKCR